VSADGSSRAFVARRRAGAWIVRIFKQLRHVPCPTCGVVQGAPCVTTRGKSVGARLHGTHPARTRVANARAGRVAAENEHRQTHAGSRANVPRSRPLPPRGRDAYNTSADNRGNDATARSKIRNDRYCAAPGDMMPAKWMSGFSASSAAALRLGR